MDDEKAIAQLEDFREMLERAADYIYDFEDLNRVCEELQIKAARHIETRGNPDKTHSGKLSEQITGILADKDARKLRLNLEEAHEISHRLNNRRNSTASRGLKATIEHAEKLHDIIQTVRKEELEPSNRSNPIKTEQPLTDAEREAIAEYHGVDADQIREDKDGRVYVISAHNKNVCYGYVPESEIRYILAEC